MKKDYTREEINAMVKLMPNDFEFNIFDLYEIFSQDEKKNGL